MSGARTPKATRSKFWTPASATRTRSGTRPAGPTSPRNLREDTATGRSDLDIRRLRGRLGDHDAGPGEGVCPSAVSGIGDEARHEDVVPGRDPPEDPVPDPEDELAESAGEEHQQDDDPCPGSEHRPPGWQQVLHAVHVEGPEDGAGQGPETADHHHREELEPLLRVERAELEPLLLDDEQSAGQARDDAGD